MASVSSKDRLRRGGNEMRWTRWAQRWVVALLALPIAALALACGNAETPPTATASKDPAPATAPAPPQAEEKPPAPPAPKSETASPAQLIAKGRQVYRSNCTACHNPNPAEDGAIGPATADASLALLEAKVIHNTYPPGYTPKRDTHAMIALPYLQKDIPALHAYLASVH